MHPSSPSEPTVLRPSGPILDQFWDPLPRMLFVNVKKEGPKNGPFGTFSTFLEPQKWTLRNSIRGRRLQNCLKKCVPSDLLPRMLFLNVKFWCSKNGHIRIPGSPGCRDVTIISRMRAHVSDSRLPPCGLLSSTGQNHDFKSLFIRFYGVLACFYGFQSVFRSGSAYVSILVSSNLMLLKTVLNP